MNWLVKMDRERTFLRNEKTGFLTSDAAHAQTFHDYGDADAAAKKLNRPAGVVDADDYVKTGTTPAYGTTVRVDRNKPLACDPTSETYWSM